MSSVSESEDDYENEQYQRYLEQIGMKRTTPLKVHRTKKVDESIDEDLVNEAIQSAEKEQNFVRGFQEKHNDTIKLEMVDHQNKYEIEFEEEDQGELKKQDGQKTLSKQQDEEGHENQEIIQGFQENEEKEQYKVEGEKSIAQSESSPSHQQHKNGQVIDQLVDQPEPMKLKTIELSPIQEQKPQISMDQEIKLSPIQEQKPQISMDQEIMLPPIQEQKPQISMTTEITLPPIQEQKPQISVNQETKLSPIQEQKPQIQMDQGIKLTSIQEKLSSYFMNQQIKVDESRLPVTPPVSSEIIKDAQQQIYQTTHEGEEQMEKVEAIQMEEEAPIEQSTKIQEKEEIAVKGRKSLKKKIKKEKGKTIITENPLNTLFKKVVTKSAKQRIHKQEQVTLQPVRLIDKKLKRQLKIIIYY